MMGEGEGAVTYVITKKQEEMIYDKVQLRELSEFFNIGIRIEDKNNRLSTVRHIRLSFLNIAPNCGLKTG